MLFLPVINIHFLSPASVLAYFWYCLCKCFNIVCHESLETLFIKLEVLVVVSIKKNFLNKLFIYKLFDTNHTMNTQKKTECKNIPWLHWRTIENALQDVPRLGLNGAHRAHSIPYGTLYNKYHGKHTKKHGKQLWYVTILHLI